MKGRSNSWAFAPGIKISALLGALLLLGSCTGLRFSTPERPLFTGYGMEWTEVPAYDPGGARRELEGLVEPSANSSILGMRPMVALHNGVKEPKKKKGWRYWLKYKVGAQPVYLEQLRLKDINEAMENRLNNRGFFAADSRYKVVKKRRTASVIFSVSPGVSA